MYSSKRKAEELRYTRDEGVVLVGELELELPEVGRLVRDRVVEILFDFSHTEIQVWGSLPPPPPLHPSLSLSLYLSLSVLRQTYTESSLA